MRTFKVMGAVWLAMSMSASAEAADLYGNSTLILGSGVEVDLDGEATFNVMVAGGDDLWEFEYFAVPDASGTVRYRAADLCFYDGSVGPSPYFSITDASCSVGSMARLRMRFDDGCGPGADLLMVLTGRWAASEPNSPDVTIDLNDTGLNTAEGLQTLTFDFLDSLNTVCSLRKKDDDALMSVIGNMK